MCAAAWKPRATWARRPRSKMEKLNTTNTGRRILRLIFMTFFFGTAKKSKVTQPLVFPEKAT